MHGIALQEVTHLKSILGLQHDKVYDTPESRAKLRYGKVMLMTDQVFPGSELHQHTPCRR